MWSDKISYIPQSWKKHFQVKHLVFFLQEKMCHGVIKPNLNFFWHMKGNILTKQHRTSAEEHQTHSTAGWWQHHNLGELLPKRNCDFCHHDDLIVAKQTDSTGYRRLSKLLKSTVKTIRNLMWQVEKTILHHKLDHDTVIPARLQTE